MMSLFRAFATVRRSVLVSGIAHWQIGFDPLPVLAAPTAEAALAALRLAGVSEPVVQEEATYQASRETRNTIRKVAPWLPLVES